MSTTCENQTAVQQPKFTTREDETGVHLQIALPGVKKENLTLTLKQSVLQIEATRTSEVAENWKTHSASPQTISYQLNARLTEKLDGGNVKASLENGVLTLDIPIREEAKPRQIFVN
jgi:HSP20 family protein